VTAPTSPYRKRRPPGAFTTPTEGSENVNHPAAADPSQDADAELMLALIKSMKRMRAEARFSIQQFVMAAEGGLGGTLVLQAPYRTSRTIIEAGFQTENWPLPGRPGSDR